MKKIQLISVVIDNFKGLLHYEYVFDGKDATITAENGKGKTSIADAIQWLLSDKDTNGKSSASDLRPNDINNDPIRGLTMSVEAVYDIDGTVVKLKKCNNETLTKGVVSGFMSSCFIDDEPTKVNEFKKYITGIIPADILLTLTILDHFCGSMHHTACRKILLELIEVSTVPPGFDDLKSCKGDKTIEGYAKSLKFLLNGDTHTDGHKGEQKKIEPAINELTRLLADCPADTDVADIETSRTVKEGEIANFQTQRLAVTGQETARQDLIDELNDLKTDKSNRENELRNDKSGIQKYLNEKNDTLTGIGKVKMEITGVNQDITGVKGIIENMNTALERATKNRDAAASEIDVLEDPENKANACPKCGHDLEEKHKTSEIARLTEIGKRAFLEIKKIKAEQKEKRAERDALNESLGKCNIKLQEATTARTDRFGVIDAIIAENKTTAPEQDEKWIKINNDIGILQLKIGDPVSDQIQAIDEKGVKAAEELATINSQLASHDTAESTRTRIQELNERETELGEKIVSIEGKLSEIDEYKTAQNNLISKNVNDKFEHVTFRMFTENIGDDGVKDDCTALYKGNAYKQCSTGEKIKINNAVIDTLSEYYKISMPRFIDDFNNLTSDLKSNGQAIKLVAKKDVKTLTVS